MTFGSLLFTILLGCIVQAEYTPDWSSLDKRPLPKWYDEAKIGIFLHWGVFSVPSFGSEWFWETWQGSKSKPYIDFMKKNYPPDFTYQDFAKDFTAEFFDPEEWARIFNASGAQYIVLTSKHHEGFTLWPSKYSWSWNAKDVGPNRDLVGDLAHAIRTITPHIHFGLYHSLYEWFNPLYLEDKKNKYQTQDFVHGKTMPELYELVNSYHPEVIWSDGDWEAEDKYWNSTIFLSWLFNKSPVKDTVVVNDRWGRNIPCHHGSFYTCTDRYNPGILQPHKWENCMTLDKHSWGYRRNSKATDYLTINDLLKELVETVSCGGNILINAGPTHDGMIPAIMEERLLQLGSWLGLNGEAIYKSIPWTHQNDTMTSGVWYTLNGNSKDVYGIVLNWPIGNVLMLASVITTPNTTINMIGYSQPLQFKMVSKGLQIAFPLRSEVKGDHAFVLKLHQVKPKHSNNIM